MRLFLIRHGRTPANNERKLVGQKYDGDLIEFGVEQIQKLACELSSKPISAIISSPLTRAKHSAEILKDSFINKIPLTTDPRIVERDYGDFELLNREQLVTKKANMGIVYGDTTNYFPDSVGGVELRETVFLRMQNSINWARAKFGNDSILAYVTHGGTIYSFITESLRIPEELERPFKIREASYLECEVDNQNIIEVMALWNNPIQ